MIIFWLKKNTGNLIKRIRQALIYMQDMVLEYK